MCLTQETESTRVGMHGGTCLHWTDQGVERECRCSGFLTLLSPGPQPKGQCYSQLGQSSPSVNPLEETLAKAGKVGLTNASLMPGIFCSDPDDNQNYLAQ